MGVVRKAAAIERLKSGEELNLTLPFGRKEKRTYELSGGGEVSEVTAYAILPSLDVSQPSLFPDAEPLAYRWRDE